MMERQIRKDSMVVYEHPRGLAICGDCMAPDVLDVVRTVAPFPLVVTDPPYGGIVSEHWDRWDDVSLAKYLGDVTRTYAAMMPTGSAMYVWGGVGTVKNRAFLRYILETEDVNQLELGNWITWSKRRAYGVQNNYLFTREECAYWVVGNAKRPRKFNIPLLDTKRGYAGYNPKYPAKSEYLRRTNVWTDITEMFRGKVHPTQKPEAVFAVPILVHTDPDEYVVDPFAGSGTTAIAALDAGRRFVVIEQDPAHFATIVKRIADHGANSPETTRQALRELTGLSEDMGAYDDPTE